MVKLINPKLLFAYIYSWITFKLSYYDKKYFEFCDREVHSKVIGKLGSRVSYPKRVKRLRILRSPHVNKKSMELFMFKKYKVGYNFFNEKLYKAFIYIMDYVSFHFKNYELGTERQ